MNTGGIRIAIVVALVVAGVVVLRSGFGGGVGIALPSGASPPASPTASPSRSRSPKPTSTPSPQVAGVITAVFNGTTAFGLAAAMEQTLTKDGYVFPVHAENSPTIPLAKSIVYYRGGADAAQNRSDAQYVADTYLKSGAKVKELAQGQASLVDKTVQIAIFIGNDFHA